MLRVVIICIIGIRLVLLRVAWGAVVARALLRGGLLRLCGAKAVLLAGADGYKPGTPAYADSLLHAHTGRGAAFNTAMAGAIKACGLDVTFITPSEYAK